MSSAGFNVVLEFWFNELTPEQWWLKDNKLDNLIKIRFAELHKQATHCELYTWRESAKGRLAEILVLDQFSRNIYRDTPQAFSADTLALALAQEALNSQAEQSLTVVERNFLLMPFMHSESLAIHNRAVTLFQQYGDENSLNFEQAHRDIIKQYGRYPHRNVILGRTSTAAELSFLQQPNSSF